MEQLQLGVSERKKSMKNIFNYIIYVKKEDF